MLEASVLLLSDCSGSLTHSYITFGAYVLPGLHSFTPLQRNTVWWDNPAACCTLECKALWAKGLDGVSMELPLSISLP